MSDLNVCNLYVVHNKQIPDLIDQTKFIEELAKQACDLLNMHRFQARELMKKQEQP